MTAVQYATKLPASQTCTSPIFAQVFERLINIDATVQKSSVTASNKQPLPEYNFDSRAADREDLFAIARIRDFGTYAAGWDGLGSVPPSRRTLKEAEVFARYLFGLGRIDAPYISPSSDGEVNFYWKTNNLLLDLGFFGDGTYSYYARLPNGRELIEDEAPLDKTLPSEVIDLISQAA
jgi:hypothetical protein